MTWISSSRRSRRSSLEEEPAEAADRLRPLVLVIEDDPESRRMLRSYLAGLDARVVEAENGRAALSVLEKVQPDFVCLSLALPELSGYSLCEFMRSSAPLQQVPVLIMSARATPADRAEAEEVGASAFLAKPFTQHKFVQCIAGILATIRTNT